MLSVAIPSLSLTRSFLYGMLAAFVAVQLFLVLVLPPLSDDAKHLLSTTHHEPQLTVIPKPNIYSNPHAPQKFAIQYPSDWGEPEVFPRGPNAADVVFGKTLTIRSGVLNDPHTQQPLSLETVIPSLYPHVESVETVIVNGIQGKKVNYRSAGPMFAIVLSRPHSSQELVILTASKSDDQAMMNIINRSISTFTMLHG